MSLNLRSKIACRTWQLRCSEQIPTPNLDKLAKMAGGTAQMFKNRAVVEGEAAKYGCNVDEFLELHWNTISKSLVPSAPTPAKSGVPQRDMRVAT